MVRNQDLSRNFFVFSFFYCLNKPLSCQRNIKLLRTVIILRQTYTYDIWQAQLHDLSDDSIDDEDNVNNIFYNLDKDGSCIDDNLTGAVLEYAVKKYKSHRRLSASINVKKPSLISASR